MKGIKIACETYTWQMPGEGYKGKLDHIMGIAQQAGFEGIEPEASFFGSLSDPIKMKEELEANGLELTALCHVEDWRQPRETASEKANAEKWIEFLRFFPDTIYLLVQMPGEDREHLKERQTNLLSCVNAISRRAADLGIVCSYHPNSPAGSIFRTREDYNILMEGLDSRYIGYTPDVGHIAKGGMDPLSIVSEYRELVNLIHYKDMDVQGNWVQTGEGSIDFHAITKFLIESQYEGWIVMEDESDLAITQPDEVTLADGEYIRKEIRPLIQ